MAAVQWIPLAYQLTIVGLVLSMARLGDKLGRKGLYTLGFIMLGVGSAACGLSPYLWLIVCFRAIEGIGGALVLANGRAIASALYAKEGRGRALGMMSMSFHLGYITGPSVGGFLVDTIGWRWIFFMNLPVALAAATMAWKILPETVTEKRDYSIDPIGMVTLLTTVVALVVGLQQVAKSGFGWPALLAGGVAVTSLLSAAPFRAAQPGAVARSLAFQSSLAHRRTAEPFLRVAFAHLDVFLVAVLSPRHCRVHTDAGRLYGDLLFSGHRCSRANRGLAG